MPIIACGPVKYNNFSFLQLVLISADNEGYCHRHPHVRLAKKKVGTIYLFSFFSSAPHRWHLICIFVATLNRGTNRSHKLTGGWKILQDTCVECSDEQDDNRSVGSRNSRRSARSRGGRGSRHSLDYSDTDSESSSIRFGRNQKKSASHRDRSPRNGKCERDNEMPVGASCKKGNSGGSSRDAQRQQALREYKDMYNSIARVVKNMIFEDASGDLGRYTGEVNGEKIPHGMGNVVYVNGLVKGGKWVSALRGSLIRLTVFFCIPLPISIDHIFVTSER